MTLGLYQENNQHLCEKMERSSFREEVAPLCAHRCHGTSVEKSYIVPERTVLVSFKYLAI